MADSLFLPLAAKSSNAHSSLFFGNCPSPSRLLPPKSSSLLLHGGEKKISVLALSLYSRVSLPHRAAPIRALDSDVPHPLHKGSVNFKKRKSYVEWDSLTAKFTGAANLPFLLLQLPQIILNTRNLMAGNKTALLAVPWLGMFTALLGNLSLLSYFVKKRETEAVVVQTLGVISTFAVISQLAIGEAMPLPQYVATSVVVAAGHFKFFELLWYAQLDNLAILGRFYDCRWTFSASPGKLSVPCLVWTLRHTNSNVIYLAKSISMVLLVIQHRFINSSTSLLFF
ncbi:maltose excess protein 1, chloroplastic-like [Gossypium australe]|uniref:Maltose excess protein 1, chloroplastic-like n=1 Tax=Gossypium australe TaxID=47621 RepID=A0A5B6VW40_9ROSI|nr:maltose excess protein 1, chloroplastic-like [Gossypium australe]